MSQTESLTIYRLLPHPVGRVFEAWRSPEMMSRWFSADGWKAAVTSEFRVGGEYQIQMTDAGGGGHVQFGEYLAIEPESLIRFSWSCHEIGVANSVVTVVLNEHPDGTEMTLTHELLDNAEIAAMHNEGWVRCLAGLEQLLGRDG